MPTLAELQEEADAIRSESRIWDDPELCSELRSASRHAGRILGHYERSITALHEINDAPGDDRAATRRDTGVTAQAELPRFSDAAPYLPKGTPRAERAESALG
ncbi:hypothetical protein [Erythrobacter sp. THAF29]|uniref:hypothetical protein n=1 Tax=Erythrobacter sp. THAF29 TaxID=2587851 RepID=UPI001268C00B|nr:hypothetical protein [Erythrobacter sp. THAF29]